MTRRLIDCSASEVAGFSKEEKLASLAGCEGRVMAAETIGCVTPLLGDISNAELASSLGADILLLNLFDTLHPEIEGLPAHRSENTIRLLKHLTGRLLGINLEPAELPGKEGTKELWHLTEGRRATAENAERARDMGIDLIVVTGNPGVGVSNPAICAALKELKAAVGNDVILVAGKMHASGILSEQGRSILTDEDIDAFADAGADIILMPAPGTVPGVTQEMVGALAAHAHQLGKLALSSIGTSQEGADVQTIRSIALMSKMAGIDIHHIGDSGYTGIAVPENLIAYSEAIRGRRHTLRDMARSRLR